MTMRLLVFDDDPAIGRLVVRVAVLAGLEASTVTDAAAFRQSLHDAPPQIVVLDLQLGATDGVEQVRFLAEQHYAGALIVMSGFDDRVLAAAAAVARHLGLNLAATLTKPIAVDALEKVLQPLQAAWDLLSPARLLAAINGDELSLEFQPIVTRRPRALKALEALVRWEHPTLGSIPPGNFLPAAEAEKPVIDALTEWVIDSAVDGYLILRELGISVPIAVNVSAANLHDRSLPDRIAQRLLSAGIPVGDFCLELTETAASQDTSRMMDVLTRARLKGLQLSIDDFGTGYSSLKALRQLPFSKIKIDRSFVTDITTSRDSRVIVKSIIDLAANMDMDCIAEGVETEATAELLEHMNVGSLQGFLIAPPLPVEAVPAWLAVWLAGGEPSPPPSPATSPGTSNAAEGNGPATGTGTSPTPAAPGEVVAAPGATRQAAASSAAALALTPRQVDVMRLLTEGCAVKEIARRLGLGVGTVKVHLSQAYTALGARNRVEAVMRAGLGATRGD